MRAIPNQLINSLFLYILINMIISKQRKQIKLNRKEGKN